MRLELWQPAVASIAGARALPLAIRDGRGRLCAAAPAFSHRLSLSPVLRRGPGVLELGPPCYAGPPWIGDPGRRDALLAAAEDLARRESLIAIVVRDIASAGDRALLRRHGYAPIASRPTMVLDLAGAGFDDYLAALRSSYRRAVRSALRLPLTVEWLGTLGEALQSATDLIAVTTDRSTSGRREHLSSEVLEAWMARTGVEAMVIRGAAPTTLGVAMVMIDPPVLHFLRCGFESGPESATLYRRMLVELVRRAAETGCRYVDFGSTTEDPKARLGAVPVSLEVWGRLRSPRWLGPLHRFIRLRPTSGVPERRALRTPVSSPRASWLGA